MMGDTASGSAKDKTLFASNSNEKKERNLLRNPKAETNPCNLSFLETSKCSKNMFWDENKLAHYLQYKTISILKLLLK